MGLYLCIFDQNGDDICGVEVGLYSYFGEFRDLVSKFTNKDFLSRVLKRKSKFSLPMTTLLNHSDCDGSWNVDECVHLKMELQEIKQIFINEPPDLSIIELKQDIFKFNGVKPENLFDNSRKQANYISMTLFFELCYLFVWYRQIKHQQFLIIE